MSDLRIVARVDREQPEGRAFLVRSPAVGVVDRLPRSGNFLNPGEGFLVLRVLGRRVVVLLPWDVQGRVAERLLEGTTVPVEFDQPLLRLRLGAEAEGEAAAAAGGRAAAGAAGDLIPVPSPSEGIFYRKPGPDSPPYVEVGTRVQKGSVLGLVEVMKSFNQITYGGPGLPESGTVERIMVEDSTEVTFGQPLVLIKPESQGS